MPWTWQSTPQHEPCCPESLGDIIYSLIQGVYHASISSSEIILEKFLFIKVLLRRWTGSWTPRMRTKAERVRVIQQLKWRVFWELIFKNTTLNIDYSDLRQTLFSNTECTKPARHLHEKTLHSFSQRILCTAKSFGHLRRRPNDSIIDA